MKKSGIEGTSWGLFSAKTFGRGHIISVYIGKFYKPGGKQDSHYRLAHDGMVVDPVVVKDENGNVPLYWGAHLANDLNWKRVVDPLKVARRGKDKGIMPCLWGFF